MGENNSTPKDTAENEEERQKLSGNIDTKVQRITRELHLRLLRWISVF